MVARIIIPLLLAILLPQVYIDRHFLVRRLRLRWWKQMLCWLPALAMTGYCVGMACIRDFVPHNNLWIELFFILLTWIVLPVFLFTVCSCVGWLWCIMTRSHRNWGNIIGPFVSLVGVGFFFYGFTFGEAKLSVRHVHLYLDDLPKAFDGYRITQFSDFHVGTYRGWRYKISMRKVPT